MRTKDGRIKRTPRLKRAARRAERLLEDYAQNGATTRDKLIRAIDRVDTVFTEEMGYYTVEEREELLDELAHIRRALPIVEDRRYHARKAEIEAEIERLKDEQRAARGEVRYVPGVGYTSR